MDIYPNAWLIALRRELLVRRHIDEHAPLAELAAKTGISLLCANKCLVRWPFGATSGRRRAT